MAATDKAYHLEQNGANFYLKSPNTIKRMCPYIQGVQFFRLLETQTHVLDLEGIWL